MSSDKTTNLALHKWAGTDPVERTEFNDNFGIIDSKIGQYGVQKADKAYVDTQFSKVNAGPRGVYATLVALQAAYPTGDAYNKLVTADNNWYYWNGSAWVAGGIYQSAGLPGRSVGTSKIGTSSVTPNETSFLTEVRQNLFNKDAAIQGYALDSSGNLTANANFVTSDWILVKPGTTYYLYTTSGVTVGLYDADKKFISLTTYNQNPITTTAGTFYVRTSTALANLNAEYLSETNGTTAKYTDRTVSIADGELQKSLVDLVFNQGAIAARGLSFLAITKSKNLFDKNSDALVDGYIDQTGSVLQHATLSYKTSGFIEVGSSTTYYQYSSNYGVYYDRNKNVIGYKDYNVKTFTTPKNCVYYRTSCLVSELPSMFVSTENAYSKYDYNAAINTDLVLPLNNALRGNLLRGKKWAVIGDSITETSANGVTHYHTYISDDTGCTVVDLAKSGTGYLKTNGASEHICDRIDALTGSEGYDYITIMAGINDAGGTFTLGAFGDKTKSTLAGAVYYAINAILNKFPNAKIGVITPTPTSWSHDSNAVFYELSDIIKKTCNYFSVPCLDLNGASGLKPWVPAFVSTYYVDSTHLTSAAQKAFLAPKIKRFLENL